MKDFYECLGLEFVEEQHGRGPKHYAAVSTDGLVLELYPAGRRIPSIGLRLGLSVKSLEEAKKSLIDLRSCDDFTELTPDGMGFVVYDPENNTIEVREM
jgi:hypothetical protein